MCLPKAIQTDDPNKNGIKKKWDKGGRPIIGQSKSSFQQETTIVKEFHNGERTRPSS